MSVWTGLNWPPQPPPLHRWEILSPAPPPARILRARGGNLPRSRRKRSTPRDARQWPRTPTAICASLGGRELRQRGRSLLTTKRTHTHRLCTVGTAALDAADEYICDSPGRSAVGPQVQNTPHIQSENKTKKNIC